MSQPLMLGKTGMCSSLGCLVFLVLKQHSYFNNIHMAFSLDSCDHTMVFSDVPACLETDNPKVCGLPGMLRSKRFHPNQPVNRRRSHQPPTAKNETAKMGKQTWRNPLAIQRKLLSFRKIPCTNFPVCYVLAGGLHYALQKLGLPVSLSKCESLLAFD